MTEYALALMVTFLLAWLDRAAFLSAIIVTGDFMANEAWVRLTGQSDAWIVFSLIDALAITALLYFDTSKVGGAVASLYCTQMIISWAYGLATSGKDWSPQMVYSAQHTYWQTLTALAFLQLAFLSIGGIYGGGRRILRINGVCDIPRRGHSLGRGSIERGADG